MLLSKSLLNSPTQWKNARELKIFWLWHIKYMRLAKKTQISKIDEDTAGMRITVCEVVDSLSSLIIKMRKQHNVISWKLLRFFPSVWRTFCKNFKQQCWFVLFFQLKRGAEILKNLEKNTNLQFHHQCSLKKNDYLCVL